MIVKNVQVNHMRNPMGIGVSHIRIQWVLEGGIRQSAYQVRVTGKEGKITADSGIVASSDMFYYLPMKLQWREEYQVCVCAWDENEEKAIPGEGAFVTGIARDEWKAQWINPELQTPKYGNRPASYLRRSFTLSQVQLEEAKTKGAFLYAACHGIMNIQINGMEITDHLLLPGTQQYNKRLRVETVNVAAFLREGTNDITVSLGDGWYRGSMGMGQAKNVYGKDVALLLQLEISKEAVLVTDETWEATQNGPIGCNDFMDGEQYDARKEKLTGFHKVLVEKFGFDNLIANDTVPVTGHEELTAKWIVSQKGDKVLDFGQNIVGFVKMAFCGQAGKKVTLIHGETLDKNGDFTIENFQAPGKPVRQQVDYICKDGWNEYHCTKTYMGFRYVKVEADFEMEVSAFTAVAVYSDVPVTASFTCKNKDVNKLFQNALWSMKGNFIDVPTDCPTREKSGYSGDAQAFIHTAMYLMDCYPVYAKWIREQGAGQYKDGVIPQVSPKKTPPKVKDSIGGVISTEGGIGWSDSFEIVPYRLWERYGDIDPAKEQYKKLKRWTEYEIKRASRTRLVNLKEIPVKYRKYILDTGWMWGEWLEPNQDDRAYMAKLVQKGDPEVGTAFLYLHLIYMQRMAKALGEDTDAKRYGDIAAKVKKAYRALFTENGKVTENHRQCRVVRPMAHDLLSGEEKREAAKKLARMIADNGNHLNTGFLTTHELCRCLSQNGQNRTAYDLLLQEEMPGWLYPVKKGCTTIPESWDCIREDGSPKNSFNHYAYGAIAGWLMDCAAGINVANGMILIKPYPDERIGFVNAVYDSVFGKIVVNWKYEEGAIFYHIEIPANANAVIDIEGMEPAEVCAGTYEYKVTTGKGR